MIGVDLWNGSASELNAFQFVTQVKFPLLQKGSNPEIPWGLDVENIIIVDPQGVIRGIKSVADRDQVVDLIDLINDSVPISELKPKSLYWGTKGEVGVQRMITVTVENSGLQNLEVTSIRSTTDQVTVDRTEFSVEPNKSEQFTITLNPTREGNLTGSVEVVTNERNWTLPITSILIEGGLPPAIALPTTALGYGTVEVGRSLSKTFDVTNEGLGPLTVTGIESDLPGATISDDTFTLGAGETKTISVTLNPAAEGTFSGVVNVLSDDPDRATISVTIDGSAQVIPADARTDFDGSGSVDFVDFLMFAGAFGTADATYDVDQNGSVDFGDFLVFVENFGRSVQ